MKQQSKHVACLWAAAIPSGGLTGHRKKLKPVSVDAGPSKGAGFEKKRNNSIFNMRLKSLNGGAESGKILHYTSQYADISIPRKTCFPQL